jgi:hypothetical protein
MVRRLFAVGLNDCEVARQTGIPRRTINRWRGGHGSARRSQSLAWAPPDSPAYPYLLGLYLGDGWLHLASERATTLVLTLDAAYEGIVRQAAAEIEAAVPGAKATRHSRCNGPVAAVQASHPAFRLAFPQHGRGKKHEREIRLFDWQLAVTWRYPRALLRGLIHSDEARTVNRFKVRLPSGRVAAYAYPRYFFTNLSADIRGIFCDHCDLLGVRWTQSNYKNVSVHDRRSVALVDEFVGPKA